MQSTCVERISKNSLSTIGWKASKRKRILKNRRKKRKLNAVSIKSSLTPATISWMRFWNMKMKKTTTLNNPQTSGIKNFLEIMTTMKISNKNKDSKLNWKEWSSQVSSSFLQKQAYKIEKNRNSSVLDLTKEHLHPLWTESHRLIILVNLRFQVVRVQMSTHPIFWIMRRSQIVVR